MDNRLFFPATQRNKKYIGNVLSEIVTKEGCILEIGSGSGEHGIEFQKRYPKIIWQTSDPKKTHRESIISWISFEKLKMKMPEPLAIDVTLTPWEIPCELIKSLIGIVSINMIHIAPWICTRALFKESGKLLDKGKFLMLYGPFKIKNMHTSKSNELFDKSLRVQNNEWGIRNLESVNKESESNGFCLNKLIKMPANNHILIYRKIT